MRGAVDVVLQGVNRCPDGHVHENAVVVIQPQVSRGASFACLQSPDEAGAAIREGIDFIQTCNEPGHQRIVERSLHPCDVDLRYMVAAGHVSLLRELASIPALLRCSSRDRWLTSWQNSRNSERTRAVFADAADGEEMIVGRDAIESHVHCGAGRNEFIN